MLLHSPFVITSRLLPGLHLEESRPARSRSQKPRPFATLALEELRDGERQEAHFILDIPGHPEVREVIRSGMQGFRSKVEAFDTMLTFLIAAAEAVAYTERTGHDSDNEGLFPPYVMQWARDNQTELEVATLDLCMPDNEDLNHSLIEE